MTGDEILTNEIKDETARRYIRVMAHSDVSVPPHLTNGLTFLKNVLMDVEGYLNIYSVVGGNEKIVERLADEIDADVEFDATVRSVEPQRDGTYRLEVMKAGVTEAVVADYVVLALPLTALSIIDWRSAALRRAMNKHIGYFDRPGHYLRVTLLFERPFWREHVSGNWFMVDGFDGCCVYDESSRQELGPHGALSFLIAGNAALGLANMSDARIEELCLDALPPAMQHGRALLIDRRVHRWMATVNAVPGGLPQRSRVANHQPDPVQLPGLLTVGDYMFDATLNGVLDSADTATDLILADVIFRRQALTREQSAAPGASVRVADNELTRSVFEGSLLTDLLSISYGARRGSKILCVGVGAPAMVAALRASGYEAWGLELADQRLPDGFDRVAGPLPGRRHDRSAVPRRLLRRGDRARALLFAAQSRPQRHHRAAAGGAARDRARLRHHRSGDRPARALRLGRRRRQSGVALGLVGPVVRAGLRSRPERSGPPGAGMEAGRGGRRRPRPLVRGCARLALLRLPGGGRAGRPARASGAARAGRGAAAGRGRQPQ